ncbi:MAG: PorV/PorQ family protein [Endomicrobia bacterium]|nr:PorV/PorQ family protein [Endomicrobiia bacterium]
MKKAIIILIFYSINVIAAGASGLTTSLALRFYPSAEASGMGNTFSSIGETAEVIYYNPSNLSNIERDKKQFFINYATWIFDMYDASLVFAYPIADHTVGFAFRYFYIGEITETIDPQQQERKLLLYNLLSLISYSYKISNIKLAVNLKNLLQDYGRYKISSIVFDIAGGMDVENFKIALNLSNLGGPLKINNVDNPQPFLIKIGAGYKLNKIKLGLDLDIVEGNIKLHIGAEYKITKEMKIRFGYEQIDEFNFLKGISFGFGYEGKYEEIPTFKREIVPIVAIFNYSLTYLTEELGLSHRISVGTKF